MRVHSNLVNIAIILPFNLYYLPFWPPILDADLIGFSPNMDQKASVGIEGSIQTPDTSTQPQNNQAKETNPLDDVGEKLGNLFLDDSYSISSVLKLVHKRQVNLSQLHDLLQQHQKNLNQTSLELFNTNYDRFYKLSCIISCLSEPVQRLVNPLRDYQSKLSELCQNHNSYLATIDDRLARLETTSKNKELAVHLIELIRRHRRLDKQIKSIKILTQTASDIVDGALNLETRIDLDSVERVSRQIHFTIQEVEETKPSDDELILIRKTLHENLCNSRDYLSRWLYDVFQEAINTKNKSLIEFVLQVHRLNGNVDLDRVYLNHIHQELSKSLEEVISHHPFSESNSSLFKLKICAAVYELVKKCWLSDTYIEILEIGIAQLACRLLQRFSEWLGKLRLSDFKVTGWSARDNQESNFLAKQDAAMKLLIADCTNLIDSVQKFCDELPSTDDTVSSERKDLISKSLLVLDSGLNNVRSLQRLMER